MFTLQTVGLLYTATDPGINFWEVAANNGAAVVVLGLFLFTTKVRTGNDYDGMVRQFTAQLEAERTQFNARISDKDEVIESQSEIIRSFHQASVVSSAAMAKSVDVIEAIPDKESAVLGEVRALVARLESFTDGKKPR